MPLPVITLAPGAFGRRPAPPRFSIGMYLSPQATAKDGMIHAPFPAQFVVRDPLQRHGAQVRVVRVGIESAHPPTAAKGVHLVPSAQHWGMWIAEVERVRPARPRKPAKRRAA